MKNNKIRNTAVIIILLLFAIPCIAGFDIKSKAIIGHWYSQDKSYIVKIFETNNKFYGKITWLKYPNDEYGRQRTDKNNPDEHLKNRHIRGLIILNDFVYYKNNIWDNGTIYSPKIGKTYSCIMTLIDKNKLEVRGYKGIPMFGKTAIWTRIK